jgi:hypothetical protein
MFVTYCTHRQSTRGKHDSAAVSKRSFFWWQWHSGDTSSTKLSPCGALKVNLPRFSPTCTKRGNARSSMHGLSIMRCTQGQGNHIGALMHQPQQQSFDLKKLRPPPLDVFANSAPNERSSNNVKIVLQSQYACVFVCVQMSHNRAGTKPISSWNATPNVAHQKTYLRVEFHLSMQIFKSLCMEKICWYAHQMTTVTINMSKLFERASLSPQTRSPRSTALWSQLFLKFGYQLIISQIFSYTQCKLGYCWHVEQSHSRL